MFLVLVLTLSQGKKLPKLMHKHIMVSSPRKLNRKIYISSYDILSLTHIFQQIYVIILISVKATFATLCDRIETLVKFIRAPKSSDTGIYIILIQ